MLPDDEVILEHAKKPYDPAKAHEYYMRTRKLHPRKRGVSYTVRTSSGKTEKLSSNQYAEQKAYADHRVSVIKDRLQNLQSELQKKMADAKKKPTAADKSKQKRESKQYREKHKTEIAAKQKQAAVKAAPTPAKSATSTSGSSSSSTATKKTAKKSSTVDSLATRIINTKEDLHNAVEKQRELATAKRNG